MYAGTGPPPLRQVQRTAQVQAEELHGVGRRHPVGIADHEHHRHSIPFTRTTPDLSVGISTSSSFSLLEIARLALLPLFGTTPAAFGLGLSRLFERERAVLDFARALVRGDDHAGGRGLRVDELQAGRDGAAGEEALAAAEQDGDDPRMRSGASWSSMLNSAACRRAQPACRCASGKLLVWRTI